MCERFGPFAFGIALTHIPAKRTPVRRQEHASGKELRACPDSEGSGHALGETDRLRLVVRRWSVFGIPLPSALAPFGSAFGSAADGRFQFHVEIRLPLIGLVVGYRGWLVPSVKSG
jgi:hypothetical protein